MDGQNLYFSVPAHVQLSIWPKAQGEFYVAFWTSFSAQASLLCIPPLCSSHLSRRKLWSLTPHLYGLFGLQFSVVWSGQCSPGRRLAPSWVFLCACFPFFQSHSLVPNSNVWKQLLHAFLSNFNIVYTRRPVLYPLRSDCVDLVEW